MTKTVYKIRGKYPGCPWEDIDEFDTKEEAQAMLSEYRMAYGPEWRLCIKKEGAGWTLTLSSSS